ncbi:hypothetical protein, partial [Salmonella enterica]
NHTINTFEPLLGRIDPKHVEAMVEASKDSLAPAEAKPAPKKAREEKAKPMTEATATPTAETAVIGIDDFAKLDLRIGKVTT